MSKRLKTENFTLVELLIVIAIIALLAGILLPALGAARREARIAGCATQLRQIGQTLEFYADDYAGMIPDTDGTYWGTSIPIARMGNGTVYALGKLVTLYRLNPLLFGCPENPTRLPQSIRDAWEQTGTVQTAYLYRETDVGFLPKKAATANRNKALVVDFACLYATGNVMPHQYESVNILYNDGHVWKRRNSAVPGELYTMKAEAGQRGVPPCPFIWEHADR